MKMYCRSCHRTHEAWTRLNDGFICGCCGSRERNPQILPVNREQEPVRRPVLRLKPA